MISSVRLVEALAGHRAEPVEQQLPRGDRGQGQGGGLCERQAARLPADDPRVDQMEFGIGALAQDRSGIKHLVARLEEGDLRADRVDDARGVKAQDLGLAGRRGRALAHLIVDRIGGDCLHSDANVVARRLALRGLEIDQRVRGLNRQRFCVAHGLHAQSSRSCLDVGGGHGRSRSHLKRFRAKWTPVRVRTTRQNHKTGASVSTRSEQRLWARFASERHLGTHRETRELGAGIAGVGRRSSFLLTLPCQM